MAQHEAKVEEAVEDIDFELPADDDIAYFVAATGIDFADGERVEANDHVDPSVEYPEWLLEQGLLQPVRFRDLRTGDEVQA